jgi:hypothetical protein
MRTRTHITALGMVVSCIALGSPARALDGSERAREALGLCHAAADASPMTRKPMLQRGLAMAEEAVTADERDALAHFAVFCTLGRKMQHEGVGLGSLAAVRRLRREIDRVLELKPTAVDALVAKAAFLNELPGMLGGDEDEAERLIRQAVALEPRVGDRIAEARDLLAKMRRDG